MGTMQSVKIHSVSNFLEGAMSTFISETSISNEHISSMTTPQMNANDLKVNQGQWLTFRVYSDLTDDSDPPCNLNNLINV